MSEQNGGGPLRITTHLEFPYKRSLGPCVGAFAAGLREGTLLGARTGDGRVLVPPVEWDPATGEPLALDLVPVGPEATVTSWTWVAEPSGMHPLGRPFAFAQLRPDGADTTLVHVVDAGDLTAMATGMRVRPRWRAQRAGRIDDIECWVPA